MTEAVHYADLFATTDTCSNVIMQCGADVIMFVAAALAAGQKCRERTRFMNCY